MAMTIGTCNVMQYAREKSSVFEMFLKLVKVDVKRLLQTVGALTL